MQIRRKKRPVCSLLNPTRAADNPHFRRATQKPPLERAARYRGPAIIRASQRAIDSETHWSMLQISTEELGMELRTLFKTWVG